MIHYYDATDKFIFHIQINEYSVTRVMGPARAAYVLRVMSFIYPLSSDSGDKFDIIFILIFFFQEKDISRQIRLRGEYIIEMFSVEAWLSFACIVLKGTGHK